MQNVHVLLQPTDTDTHPNAYSGANANAEANSDAYPRADDQNYVFL